MATTIAVSTGAAGPTVAQRANRDVHIPQLSRRAIFAIWAAAVIPMGVLAWLVAPQLAHAFNGPTALAKGLLLAMTAGLIWQGVLVLLLVGYEQRSLRWSTLREALWLRAPQSPRTSRRNGRESGRRNGRLWWVVIPLSLGLAAEGLVPTFSHSASRDFGTILDSSIGTDLFHGSWTWFTVVVVLCVFNTVLGEELLFRGFLLPRMNGAFGRWDWLVNGLLFATYHVHEPWVIPASVLDPFIFSYPAKRYRSAWISIAAHSAQSVFIIVAVLLLVL